MLDGPPPRPSIRKAQIRKCSICGIEGHKANNKQFHPDGNPNAKVGIARSSKNSAVAPPKRNVGEIDDEIYLADIAVRSDEEDDDSDQEEDEIWGVETLAWSQDPRAHEPVQPTENDKFGHPLPEYQGLEPGIFPNDVVDIDPDTDFMDILRKFITFEMFNKMYAATNSYGQLYVKKWKTVSGVDFEAFLGLILYMGLINYTGERQKLWANTWKGNVFVRSVMPYAHFNRILKAWHYTDYANYTPDEIKANKANDPFWAVAEFEKDLNDRFGDMVKPDQFLDIDEQCIPWKGRHKCRCYNKSKPVKRHFKVFSLNESTSGYQEAFYLYRGKAEERPEEISATSYPAEVLLNQAKYKNRNHILCTDNWFTSFQQLQTCIKYGIHMIGTVQKKRKGIPFSWKPDYGERQTQHRGDFESLTSLYMASADQVEDVYYTSWMDRKPVAVLHTFPTKMGVCSRMVRTNNGGWERKEYTRPTIIPIYNHGMGGTDSGDQRLEAYRPEVKTNSWIPRVLTHFVNLAVVNAFIWYGKAFPEKKLTHYKFRDKLIDLMTAAKISENAKETGEIFEKSLSKKRWSKELSRRIGAHWIYQARRPKDARVEGFNPSNPTNQRTRNWYRGACMMCGRTVDTKCEQCRVWLCVQLKPDTESTCNKEFHTLQNFDYNCTVVAEDGSNEDEEADEDN